jgi:hypothetical protein
MATRESISKKTRFDVFKRDGFQCQYCGSTPPSVVLEIDHIHPVSKGGKGIIDNLLTSCFDCNRGKAAGLVTLVPQSVTDKAIVLAERMEQLKAFEKLQKSQRKKQEKDIDNIERMFQEHFENNWFTPSFRETVRTFLKSLTVMDLLVAMLTSCGRMPDKNRAIKYFCGICWNKIKRAGDAE